MIQRKVFKNWQDLDNRDMNLKISQMMYVKRGDWPDGNENMHWEVERELSWLKHRGML